MKYRVVVVSTVAILVVLGAWSMQARSQSAGQNCRTTDVIALPNAMNGFCAGTPATAADMNHNFAQVIDWVQDKIGTVGNSNIDVPGNASVAGTLTAQGNVTAASNVSVTGNVGVSGNLGVGVAGPAERVEVAGQVVADNLPRRIYQSNVTSAADYTISNLDGNAYRRYRFEIEGRIIPNGSNRAIGVRPNGASDAASYGPGVMHWYAHNPGVEWTNTTNITAPNSSLMLPVCISHWGVDGYLMCSGEMNTKTGNYRLMRSESAFNTSGACGASSCVANTSITNAWRNTGTNITSLGIVFTGATDFDGTITIYGIE